MRWITQFEQKYGPDTVTRLESAHLTLRMLLDDCSTAPFIIPKRLLILDGFPKFDKDEVQILSRSIHPDTLLLVIEPKPDKRLGGIKELLKIAEVKEFKPMTGSALTSWVKAQLQKTGASMQTDALATLIDMTGEDQDMLSQELSKLSLFANGKPITRTDVEEMIAPTEEGVVWKLTDLLAAGKKQDALAYAHRLIERGGDAYGLWAILLNMLKNVVDVFAQLQAGNRDLNLIAQQSGVNFFAVRSISPHAAKLKQADLASFLSWAADSDIQLKTGQLRATDEAPQELLALIDRFLMQYPMA